MPRTQPKRSSRFGRRFVGIGLAIACFAIAGASSATAATGPYWDVKATWGDTNLPPGGEGEFQLQVRNVGDEGSEEALTITDELPPGVTATNIDWGTQPVGLEAEFFGSQFELPVDLSQFCSGVGTGTVTCVAPTETTVELFGFQIPVKPMASFKPYPQDGVVGYPGGYLPSIFIDVNVDPEAAGAASNIARIEGGGTPEPFVDEDQLAFNQTPASFDVRQGSFEADNFTAAYPSGEPDRKAGDHPFEQRLNFELTEQSKIGGDGSRYVTPSGLVRTVEVTLPRGMIGNPEALPKCDPVDFASGSLGRPRCPSDTQVGYISTRVVWGSSLHGHGSKTASFSTTKLKYVPVYNLKPPAGTPADLAFDFGGLVQAHIYAALDPAQDYAIKAVTPNISQIVPVRETEVTLWGVPGDPAHDKFRWFPKGPGHEGSSIVENTGAPWGSSPVKPFYTNPMDCGFDNGGHRIRVDSYEHQGDFTPVQEYPEPLNVDGCNDSRFRFEPDTELQPSDRHAGAPTGLDVHLEVPQRNDEVGDATQLYAQNGFVKAIPTPPLKKAVVTFPEGMAISPSAAQGLGTCTSAEISLGTDRPVACPDSSQYGTLTLHTPILPVDQQPKGFIYIAKQGDNPFHNFLSIYLVIEEAQRGILVKIPGRVDLDPDTGQIKVTFDDLPQFPVSDFQMTFKGGVRAALVNPTTCGPKTIKAEFFSWQDPGTPHVVTSSYDITSKTDGSPCVNSLAERPFGPKMTAGTANNVAGGYSPFLLNLSRSDDDQEFSQLGIGLPEGLTAKLAGVSACPEAGIAQAVSRVGAGEGALEQQDPSCPASSLIGTTEVGTGVGVPLTYVPGKVYLAGPYHGAPLSVVVINPAVVGPYDLGVIAVRTAINVNPTTAQVTAVSDPFPLIYQGIPVRIRDLQLRLDRPEFTLNPTSCAEKQIDAHVTGTGGDLKSLADDTVAALSARFQAADCDRLDFAPKLSLRLFGGTKRGAHPKLRAVLKMPKGGANIAGASVALPHSEFLDQSHIRGVCTRVQFAADACPAGSVYGHAVAKTPLFDQPLEGPVYLRSNGGEHVLPDLVAALRGPAAQPVRVNLVGRIDSVKGGIRNTFEVVPDAPVTTFTLSLQGGKKGLLVNSTSLCTNSHRATAKFTAQNGKLLSFFPKVRSSCRKVKGGHVRHGRGEVHRSTGEGG